jgi:RNA polymerase sigma factor (sigma-70 family)
MADTSPPSIYLLKQGDDFAWQSAFRILWPCAFHAAQHPLAMLTPSEAEDVASEALEELTRCVEKVKDFEELKPFVSRIAYCLAISLRRKKMAAKRGAAQTSSLEQMQESGETTWEPSTLENLNPTDLKELDAILQKGMLLLDDQASRMIEDHFLSGLSYKEIADKYKVPLGTVCTHIARSLKKIRSEMNKSPNLLKEMMGFLRLLL